MSTFPPKCKRGVTVFQLVSSIAMLIMLYKTDRQTDRQTATDPEGP